MYFLKQKTVFDGRLRSLGLLAVAGLHVAYAFAQDIPDPSSELQRQDRQRQDLRERIEVQPWTPSGLKTQTPPHQKLVKEKPCRQIDRVAIKGILQPKGLQIALSGVNGDDPPFGRCLGGQGITLLIQRVQNALFAQGYITSHVQVPEQDLNNNELIMTIHEGRVASIRSSTKDKDTPPLPRLVWALREGSILNLRDIEQSSDNLQRLPSLGSKIQIEPGQTPGTSDLVVTLQDQRPLRLGMSVDDGGTKTTGKLQGNATLTWDNPLGLGDLFYLTKGYELGDKDKGPRGSRNQIVHYSAPWGYWLLGATFSDNAYKQTVFGPFESYLYNGTSGQKEVALSRVLHRNAQSKTTASIKGFLRQSNNYIDDLEVLVQRRRTAGWEAGFNHQHFFQSGTLTAQIAYRRGTGAFDAQPAPEEITGQGTGRMRLTTGALHWAMPLDIGGYPLHYSTQVQWQRANTRLTPQDRFCLAGRATVRGFDGQQTLCDDRGQLWRQELSTGLNEAVQKITPFSGNLRAFLALDTGKAVTPGQDSAYKLSGMAIGFRGGYQINALFPLQWEVFWGKPLSSPEGFTAAKRTTGFSFRSEF